MSIVKLVVAPLAIELPTRSAIPAGLRVSVKFPPPLVSEVRPPRVKVLLSAVVSVCAEVSRLGPAVAGQGEGR